MSSPIERKVRLYIAAGSGIDPEKVIPGHDQGPRVEGLYASVLLINDVSRAMADRRESADDDTAEVRLHRRALYSVQWYRAGADDACDRFIFFCDSERGLQLADDYNIAIPEEIVKENIDAQPDNEWEERRNVNLTVDYQQTYTEDTGRVEHASDLLIHYEA